MGNSVYAWSTGVAGRERFPYRLAFGRYPTLGVTTVNPRRPRPSFALHVYRVVRRHALYALLGAIINPALLLLVPLIAYGGLGAVPGGAAGVVWLLLAGAVALEHTYKPVFDFTGSSTVACEASVATVLAFGAGLHVTDALASPWLAGFAYGATATAFYVLLTRRLDLWSTKPDPDMNAWG